ncbi:hypothetical protein WA026_006106 [Henosepilachna vigintioctopunctata]|uniref:Uncharacterized protein n=1 Tax=Henosepilachna vigintioctopunctata TaxID=420089 RepID=A0AAW1THV2_9CUCU
MFGKLKSGLEMAGKWLGLDRSRGVANLVSEAFGKINNRKGDYEESGNIFSGFLRMLGFDAKKIGAIAVNSIVFIAQLINKSLARSAPLLQNEEKSLPSGSPFDWLRDKADVKSQMTYMTNPQLPEDVVEYIKERSLDENTDCIQLLICKSSPIIWGMQRSLSSFNSTVKGLGALLHYLPTVAQFLNHSEVCEKQHPYCILDLS